MSGLVTVNELFVLALAVLFAGVFSWGFRSLPGEGWQIAASVPIAKDSAGHWRGLNLTYYGVLSASAYASGVAMMCVLMAAVRVPPRVTFIVVAAILAICVPASRVVARLVEGRRDGLTVGGAVFVGILATPWAVVAVNHTVGTLAEVQVPVVPALAAASIAYALGEGIGRLSCVSFGCCYGKPLSQIHPTLQRLFSQYTFVFAGKTKKIAYESGLDGEKVVPVQGITAILHVATGLVATDLFLHARHVAALCLSLLVTQVWRAVSETLRADYRGVWKISAYQFMAAAGLLYIMFLMPFLPRAPAPHADLVAGVRSLWDPSVILFLQVLWIGIFLYTGRSVVTGSTLSFFVHRERL